MATVGFRIRTKNKSYVFIKIYLYAQKSVRLETSTGIKIYSKYWNKNLQQIDYEAPNFQKNNQKLIELKKYVLDKVNDSTKNNLDLPWLKLVVNKFNGRQIFTEENTVVFQSKLWIKNNSSRIKPNTIKFYSVFIKVIIEFEKDINQRLVFEELNLVLLCFKINLGFSLFILTYATLIMLHLILCTFKETLFWPNPYPIVDLTSSLISILLFLLLFTSTVSNNYSLVLLIHGSFLILKNIISITIVKSKLNS